MAHSSRGGSTPAAGIRTGAGPVRLAMLPFENEGPAADAIDPAARRRATVRGMTMSSRAGGWKSAATVVDIYERSDAGLIHRALATRRPASRAVDVEQLTPGGREWE